MYDVVLIADQYNRYHKAIQGNHKIDPSYEARGLKQTIKAFGRDDQSIAIVAEHDQEGLNAYAQAGFEIVSMNGNRGSEVHAFITRMSDSLSANPPKHLIAVTEDPVFDFLLRDIAKRGRTHLGVWVPSAYIPQLFNNPAYDSRPLEELLPEIKVAKIDVCLDYENLHIGLKQMGWTPDPKTLIDAAKRAVADLGEVVNIAAYADWDLLSKGSNLNIQRELTLLDIKTHYLVNIRGKNTADMEIADDIRTLLEQSTDNQNSADIVVIGTRDRDFRKTVQTAKDKGKKIFVLTLQEGLSRELERVAGDNIRYLDKYLPLPKLSTGFIKQTNEHAELAMRAVVWLYNQRWKWAHTDKLIAAIAPEPDGAKCLQRAIDDGVFIEGPQLRTLTPNEDHPQIQEARHLVRWLPDRVGYLLRTKKMPYVDTNYLARGMEMDQTFSRLGVGQTRADAERLLSLAEKLGVVVKKPQPHPKAPEKLLIDTWWLPETSQGDKTSPAQAPAPSDDTNKAEAETVTSTPAEKETKVETVKPTPAGQSKTLLPQPEKIQPTFV
jgi:uncharacterized LabA/DUF88 family protein